MRNRLHTLCFEAPEDGGDLEGGGGGDVDAIDTPAADAAPADEPTPDAAPAAPAFDPQALLSDPRVLELIDGRTQQQIDQLLAEQGGDEPDDEFLLDPMADPAEFTGGLKQMLEGIVEKAIAPMMQTVDKQRMTEANEFVASTIEQLPEVSAAVEFLPAPAEGAEDTRSQDIAQAVELVAGGFLPMAQAELGVDRYPAGPAREAAQQRAVQSAIAAGGKYINDKLEAAHKSGRAAEIADRQRTADAVAEPNGAAGAADIAEKPADEREAALRFAARQRQG